jgi:hypothetical protein
MISYRKADLFQRRKETLRFNVVIDFHYDEDVKKYYCIINDPSGISEQFKDSLQAEAGAFNVGIFDSPFDLDVRDFKGCDGNFFGDQAVLLYGDRVHHLIDVYTNDLQGLGYEIKLDHDSLYKKIYEDKDGYPATGSRYLIYWSVSPKN